MARSAIHGGVPSGKANLRISEIAWFAAPTECIKSGKCAQMARILSRLTGWNMYAVIHRVQVSKDSRYVVRQLRTDGSPSAVLGDCGNLIRSGGSVGDFISECGRGGSITSWSPDGTMQRCTIPKFSTLDELRMKSLLCETYNNHKK